MVRFFSVVIENGVDLTGGLNGWTKVRTGGRGR